MSIMPSGPLAYEGQVSVPYIVKNFPPTSNFNKFPVPTVWVDYLNKNAYLLTSLDLGTAEWIHLGGVPGEVDTITTPDSTVVVPTAGNVTFANGSGISITGSGSTVTFNSVGGGLSWSAVTSATQALTIHNGYFANRGAGVAFTLPATAAVGSLIAVSAINAGGWTIAQNAGQQIRLGNQTTTLGVGGSLASTQNGDTVYLVCSVANTNFQVVHSMGNITYA